MRPSASGGAVPSAEELNRLVLAIAKDNDRQAFVILFKHFAPRVKTFLMRSGMMANNAEEIAQEAMLAVWRKAGYFDPARASATTWIFTIVRNLRIDHLRRNRQQSRRGHDPTDEAPQPSASEAMLMAAEQDARVRAALAKLSVEQGMILRLSFFSEKPHPEIARELGLPLGTVKSRIRLAMSRLRTLLDDV
jgi:RNA polymerase sigma-70 factor, ECF subfamily